MAAAIAADRRFAHVWLDPADLFDTPDEREPDDNRPDAICDLDDDELEDDEDYDHESPYDEDEYLDYDEEYQP